MHRPAYLIAIITRTIPALFLLLGAIHTTAWGQTNDMPFEPGEKLSYVLRWENVPAGTASLEVMPLTTINGEQAYHFVMTVQSNRFIDLFYKVRDRLDAYADLDMTRSLHFTKKQHEGNHQRDEIVHFDWAASQAHYSNFGEKKPPITLQAGSFDPLSAFYYTRTTPLTPGEEVQRPVTDGKKNVIGRLTIRERETITLQDGRRFDTYRVEPEMRHIGGVFKESDDARIELWLTADDRRIPVRIRSKVVIGHFIGELVSTEEAPLQSRTAAVKNP